MIASNECDRLFTIDHLLLVTHACIQNFITVAPFLLTIPGGLGLDGVRWGWMGLGWVLIRIKVISVRLNKPTGTEEIATVN